MHKAPQSYLSIKAPTMYVKPQYRGFMSSCISVLQSPLSMETLQSPSKHSEAWQVPLCLGPLRSLSV